jgi:putative lipoprotein
MRRTAFLNAAILAAIAVASAACQREGAQSTPPQQSPAPEADNPPEGVLHAYAWECDDGTTLRMRNLWRENAITLELHEGARRLPQLPSASGARYGDDSVVFWTKGSAATFERQGGATVQCRENRARSLAEDARVRGVVYRGTGNEPGWTLEIGPGTELVFVTNYGQERHEFGDAAPSGDTATGAVYAATHDAVTLEATVKREPCNDDMAGTAFDHSFVVEFGDRSYRGCGERLR